MDKYSSVVNNVDPIRFKGKVVQVSGLLIESEGPQAEVGELCQIVTGKKTVLAEVVGFSKNYVKLMPYENFSGIEPGSSVIALGCTLDIPVSEELLGRVLNSRCEFIDGKPPVLTSQRYSVFNTPPDVISRRDIDQRLITGVRAIDFFMPVGQGQRLGIFSGSGVGKSTLLGMIARNTDAEVNVIALIGERGREVNEFIKNDLGEEGLKRSVIIVSSSDSPPLSRIRGAYAATAVAEYFRDQGKNVMLLFDSLTRFAMAQREIGLAAGEPPASRGYTPSVFALLPGLLERCGTSDKGSITGFYTVLVEGDDMDEPVSDAVRGILDGHIVLSRDLANSYHYPAIDVLSSLSRLTSKVSSKGEQRVAGNLRKLISLYKQKEDLINVGAYVKGSNKELDLAIDKIDDINGFLTQEVEECEEYNLTKERAFAILGFSEESE
ncbi:MAG: FliI/YscN family ATPase [Spirochaetales bacterium]|nr:FliI/YscN family ATPase [Spirochaetales bacterium]